MLIYPLLASLMILCKGGWIWLLAAASGAALLASFAVTIVGAQELMPQFVGLASGLILGLMAAPIMTTIAEDALKADVNYLSDLLDKITAEVRRLNETVSSSLEYVRPVALNLEIRELAPVLEEAISVAVGRRGGPGVRVNRRFAETIPPFLMDRDRLRQVHICMPLQSPY